MGLPGVAFGGNHSPPLPPGALFGLFNFASALAVGCRRPTGEKP